MFSPKHRGALDRLPFQGFARCSGIQVFRLYSRPSPVTDRNGDGHSYNAGRAGLGWGGGRTLDFGGTEKMCTLHTVVVLEFCVGDLTLDFGLWSMLIYFAVVT